jgi:hypothetical protein
LIHLWDRSNQNWNELIQSFNDVSLLIDAGAEQYFDANKKIEYELKQNMNHLVHLSGILIYLSLSVKLCIRLSRVG